MVRAVFEAVFNSLYLLSFPLVSFVQMKERRKGPLLCTSEFAEEFLLQDSRSKKSHYPRSRMESCSKKSSETNSMDSMPKGNRRRQHRSPMTSRSERESLVMSNA